MSQSMTRKQFLGLSLRAAASLGSFSLVGCTNDEDALETEPTATTGDTSTTAATADMQTTASVETTVVQTAETGDAESTGSADETSADESETTASTTCTQVHAEVGLPPVGPEHTHPLAVPAQDVATGRTRTYMLDMDLGHVHWVTVTEAMFAQLRQGQEVVAEIDVDSTQHTHAVTLTCT